MHPSSRRSSTLSRVSRKIPSVVQLMPADRVADLVDDARAPWLAEAVDHLMKERDHAMRGDVGGGIVERGLDHRRRRGIEFQNRQVALHRIEIRPSALTFVQRS